MSDQGYTTDLLPPELAEDFMAKYTYGLRGSGLGDYGLGGCMQYPPIESSQDQFPLSPITDSGPYYSPLPWYGSQEEGAGEFSSLPSYETSEDNGWTYEPFSWFDWAKRDCVPLIRNDFQQQEGHQYSIDPFNLKVDPMLTATATNHNNAHNIQQIDTKVTQRKRRDSGYESGPVTSPYISCLGELEQTNGPIQCEAASAPYTPPVSPPRFRLPGAPQLSITKCCRGIGKIPRDRLLQFRLRRLEPAINPPIHKQRSPRTIQQRPRKPLTRALKPKPTTQAIHNLPSPEPALDEPHRSLASQAIAREQAARRAWLHACRERLIPSSTVTKIASEILPPPLTLTRDARDILIDCCVEFITMLSSEANDTMERESKKTIAAEHIASALKELGFPEYVDEVLLVAGEQKEEFKKREKRSRKVEESGLTQEELAEAQAVLFRQATEKYQQGPGG